MAHPATTPGAQARLRRRALAVILSAISLCAPASIAVAEPGTREVTDMSGASVAVPVVVDRIAEQFPAHTITDIMLGAGDRLVAIPQNVKTIPFLKKVFPSINAIPELFRGPTVNLEDLLALRPDVVSVVSAGVALRPFQAVGLPAVVMSFATMAQLPQSILLSGDVYGGGAQARARAFVDYFEAKASMIRGRLAGLRLNQRPSVVHIAGYPPLVVDGGPTLIRDWIRLAGGEDGTRGVAAVHVAVSVEQLLAWDPDVLIVETPGGDQGVAANTGQSVVQALASLPGWQQLRAVRTGRVFLNPQGLYPWDRFGPEDVLQIQWAAKTLHPDLFQDIDVRSEARRFYQTFFGYAVSDAELDQILAVAP